MVSSEQTDQANHYLSIPRLLEARADGSPDRSIIIAQKREPLSFRRLFLQAQEVVRTLNALGLGRNDRVAAILPNGPEMAAAFLTISSAAAFAPLNPGYRANELDFFLSDLKPSALVVQDATASPGTAVARDHSIPVIRLMPIEKAEAGYFALKGHELSRPLCAGLAEANDIALILHTSGTTSRPKMVPLTHSNLLASARNIAAVLGLTEEDRCLSIMPLFHIHGLIGAVLSSVFAGAGVICTAELGAPEFLECLEEFLPTWYTAVPTMHQAIVKRVKENSPIIGRSSLRLIRSCSAPLPSKVMMELEDLFKAPVIEAYGMTEASHQIASNPLPPNPRKQGSVGVATGTAIAIMSGSGKFLPNGEIGEIVIRGSNLTRGYENDPPVNLSAFVHGWFRTGDLGYLDEDGYLFITGRLKEIINRGGEKISSAEVDKVLMDHPAVAQATTFGMPHGQLGEDVAAAVVLKADASATERDLQHFVAFRLAEYKVPRRIVIVDAIPKSATGKLQRFGLAEKLGLAASDRIDVRSKHELVASRNPIEDALAKIWAQVLRVEPIGVHDNFFDLGGDSILAAQVISRVRDALQVELSFLTFFDAPTLAEMAASIDPREPKHPHLLAPLLSPVSRDGKLPLSFGQQRLWFFDQLEPGSPLYNRAVFLRLSGRLDRGALQNSVNEIIRRHEVVRTTFPSVDGLPRQVVSPPSNVTLSVVDLRELPEANREAEARRLAIEESLCPFDLTSDVLLRAKVLQLDEEEYVLILTTHHIAFDGWSDGILFHELSALYKAHVAGLPSPLAELPIQYADFAAWQRTSLQERALKEHLAYWKQQLAGAPPLLELPTDRSRPPVRTFRGAWHSMRLPETLNEALRILSRREDVTLYMTLLAAFQTLLWRYTGQHDIVVGTPIAGRTRVETENLIGVFINDLVLRADLSGNPSFRELLRRVRNVFLAAHAHSDLPVEKLVEALQPERDMSRNPLFQVMFQLRNTPDQALKLPDVTVEELDLDSGLARLDLTLEIVERDGSLTCRFCYNTDLFDGATVVHMAGHYQTVLEALVASPERRLIDLTAFLEGAHSIKGPRATADDDIYERSNLTKNQLLFWAGQKLRPEAPLYNVPYAFYLGGEIDRDHFQKAFQTLLNSSDALRTVIREIDGIPQQSVLPDFPYEMKFRDFSNLPDPGAAVQSWLKARCQVLFDFQRALFDCALTKLSDRQFVWFLNLHHIIADSRSIELIFHHVAQFYERSLAGCLEKTTELSAFKDYIEYEREYRRSPSSREAESYWKMKLAEPSEPLRFYGKNSDKRTTDSKKISCELGPERTLRLKQLASREEISVKTEHASIFNIFAAVLLTYLHRVTGSRFPSIGTPFHNRRSEIFRSTIGLLMEVFPLRVIIEKNDTFVSLIRKIAVEAYTAFCNSHSIGNSQGNRLYDVLLNYDPLSLPQFHGLPVRMEPVYSDHETHSMALRIRDYTGGGSLVVDFEFHCDVFDEGDSRRAVQHFLRILDGFLENPDQELDDVNLLNDAERECILADFSRSQRTRLDDLCLAQLFEDQVRKAPDRPAVLFESRSLTFAQLNFRANQLAHYLRLLGVKLGASVGICTERSLEMVVGLMGILKAGAAYVPLDPSYPKERLAFVLSDTRMPVLLSQGHVAANFPEHGAKVVCLDSEWESISRMSGESPPVETSPDHPAYVIYTSGSTGRPKGVEVTHGALTNFIGSASDTLSLGPRDRVLQFASISFDTAVEEIFPCLIRGATLVLRTDSMLDSVSRFLQRCRDWEITVLDLPTAYWHELTETLCREGLSLPQSLRLVIIGGERALRERLVQWQSAVGGRVRLLNTYGPTEGTVVSTMWDITGWDPVVASLQEVPIGRPISNIQTYILDERLNPTPIGVPGELHIAGAGLARGYLNRPDLTAEKFIPNPFNDQAGARLYKTGDLARYLPDGNMEFLSRIDHQVKIRGFRIEPGEIEAVLRQHPAVRGVLVMAPEDDSIGHRLVAYVVPDRDVSTSVSDLRNSLKEKLPDYMVPSAYVFLESLPLTSTGKVDRSALPAPDQSRPEQENPFVPPATTGEEIIAGIWAQVLHLDRVGVHDNFFELGGHSLLATQVVSRVREAVGVDLPLRVLFEHPTVAGLAVSVAAAQASRPDVGEIVDILSALESLSHEVKASVARQKKSG
ncbi:MAG: amino acid adenylation domain-containing protein [Candidatus Binatia bacterium]